MNPTTTLKLYRIKDADFLTVQHLLYKEGEENSPACWEGRREVRPWSRAGAKMLERKLKNANISYTTL